MIKQIDPDLHKYLLGKDMSEDTITYLNKVLSLDIPMYRQARREYIIEVYSKHNPTFYSQITEVINRAKKYKEELQHILYVVAFLSLSR
jgi:hypothetical protein